MSVDWTDGTYAHDGSADFDIVFTYDEAVTVTSRVRQQTTRFQTKYTHQCTYYPTDMAKDADMKMQYLSGSGTNRLVFRGRILCFRS